MGIFQTVKKGTLAVAAAAIGAVAMVGTASAALPTGVDTAMQTVQTDATSLSGIVAPVLIGILGLTITLKLIKRFANKI